MDQRQRASSARAINRAAAAPPSSQSPQPDDLYATLFEQTKSVLGKICGFYVVTHDADNDTVRLSYHVDDRGPVKVGEVHDAAVCDAVRERCPLVNDAFARIIAQDVVNSISAPLIRNQTVLGCLGAYCREPRIFETRDARALVAIAEVGALALENAKLIADIERARVQSERLEEIGRAISSSLDLPEVLRRVVDAAIELIGADAATVWLSEGDGHVRAAMTAGEIAPEQGMIMPVPPELRQRVADLRKPYFVYEDLKHGEHELPLKLRNLTPARSTLAVALIAEDHMLGALSIGHRQAVRYHQSDIELLERLSYRAASAVANARMHEQIRALSLTDPLTEMPNRRHLDIFLAKEFAAARRGRKLSVLLFDLDHFKGYNDRMGHQAGDVVLREFAKVLMMNTRAMNLAARFGGDEFITILADTDAHGAAAHAKRILKQMEKNEVLSTAGVHASVGIAAYEAEMGAFEDLIRAADRDLYLRKAGRQGVA